MSNSYQLLSRRYYYEPLTYGEAHELNNPLNNISTSIQILLEELGEDNIEHKRNLLIEAGKQVNRARDIASL